MTQDSRFSGKAFFFGFLAGAKKVVENQHELNRINVFPVPDADTGSNLATTVRYIMDNVRPTASYLETIDAISQAAIEGAVGNSGIIFAQYLYGLKVESRNDTVSGMVCALKNAVRHMMDAVADPREGTMITVIREWTDFLHARKPSASDWLDAWTSSLERARQSLAETTRKLDVLSKARVVDAGAKGMVLFLEGVVDFLKKPSFRKAYIVLPVIGGPDDSIEAGLPDEIPSRYCTEAVLKGESLDRASVRRTIEDLGDSLSVAGSEKIMRIHIHTDRPSDLFHRLKDFGTIACQKADDMKLQLESAHRRKWNIALLTDSSCDLPQDLIDYYQIHMIPVHLFFGENQYLDKVTIKSDQFYSMFDKSPVFPTTSQPTLKAFQSIYGHLASHYDSVISFHISQKFSGTFMNSLKAAERISREMKKPIVVIDSQHVSGALGLVVLKAARAVAQGLPHMEIVGKTREWISKTRLYVGVKNLKYLVRSGRVSPMKSWIANLMNIKPVISIENGAARMLDKSFSRKGSIRKIVNRLVGVPIHDYCVLHAHDSEEAGRMASVIENRTGKKPAFTMDISPAIGLHAGIGCVAVGLMTE
jgi:DegV family protein with EDD domain